MRLLFVVIGLLAASSTRGLGQVAADSLVSTEVSREEISVHDTPDRDQLIKLFSSALGPSGNIFGVVPSISALGDQVIPQVMELIMDPTVPFGSRFVAVSVLENITSLQALSSLSAIVIESENHDLRAKALVCLSGRTHRALQSAELVPPRDLLDAFVSLVEVNDFSPIFRVRIGDLARRALKNWTLIDLGEIAETRFAGSETVFHDSQTEVVGVNSLRTRIQQYDWDSSRGLFVKSN